MYFIIYQENVSLSCCSYFSLDSLIKITTPKEGPHLYCASTEPSHNSHTNQMHSR